MLAILGQPLRDRQNGGRAHFAYILTNELGWTLSQQIPLAK